MAVGGSSGGNASQLPDTHSVSCQVASTQLSLRMEGDILKIKGLAHLDAEPCTISIKINPSVCPSVCVSVCPSVNQ